VPSFFLIEKRRGRFAKTGNLPPSEVCELGDADLFLWKAFAKERDLLPSEVWELGDADLFLPRVSVLERICQG
jgi:hypothetical protein